MIMQFELKDLTNRGSTDLTEHEVCITRAVLITIPKATVRIFPTYFEVEISTAVNNNTLRAMGKEIAAQCPKLNSIKKIYGGSRQLFRKR